MKEAYYFSHDSNARNDQKILAMRSVYGAEGYGWYWIIIEMMRESSDYKIMLTKYTSNALAMQMQCTPDAAHKFIQDCINEFGLFDTDGEYFWSNSLLRRMQKRGEKSEKARQAALHRWGKHDDNSNANAMQTQCKRNAIKEKKGKENKINSTSTNRDKFNFTNVHPDTDLSSAIKKKTVGGWADGG